MHVNAGLKPTDQFFDHVKAPATVVLLYVLLHF